MNVWKNDWEKFVQEVVKHHLDGLHKDEITTHFIGNQVTWSGSIRNNELGQENTNCIALDMPDVKIRLLDGSLIVANCIFLSMKTSKLEYWREYSAGDSVTFTTDIIEPQPDFPEVEVSICSKNPEAIVSLGTANAAPVLY
jgi:hypothetical protein